MTYCKISVYLIINSLLCADNIIIQNVTWCPFNNMYVICYIYDIIRKKKIAQTRSKPKNSQVFCNFIILIEFDRQIWSCREQLRLKFIQWPQKRSASRPPSLETHPAKTLTDTGLHTVHIAKVLMRTFPTTSPAFSLPQSIVLTKIMTRRF